MDNPLAINNNSAILSVEETSTEVCGMNDRFTAMRKATGLSQKKFGDSVGMKQVYIANIELGKINIENISLKNGLIFAKHFGCRIEDLIDDPNRILKESAIRSATFSA